MNDKVSVIIPVYNPGIHFKKCIESVIHQTHSNLEIILIDDGSNDGSEKLCDEYVERDKRISVIHQKNSGVSKARNVGINIATGDYYHFPDSDDYIELDTYEYLLQIMKQHNCEAVNFEHYITYPKKEFVHSYNDDFYGDYGVRETLGKLAGGVQFCCNKLFAKRLIVSDDESDRLYFDEEIHRGEDTLFAATALQRANHIWFDKRQLYHSVQSEQSATRGHFRMDQLSILKLYDAYEPIYKKYPEVWNTYLLRAQEGLISIYYDLWSDRSGASIEKLVKKEIKRLYFESKKVEKISTKPKIKFAIFNCCPTVFCIFHLIHVKILKARTL
jgi:glycosyltransferase involved in cell wall biosynthesis